MVKGNSVTYTTASSTMKPVHSKLYHSLIHFREQLFLKNGWNLDSEMQQKLDKNDDIDILDCFYGAIALSIITISSFSVILLPVHNVIISPQYWYEIIFSSSSLMIFMVSAIAIGVRTVLDPFKKRIPFVVIDLLISCKVAEALVICLGHLIWSVVLGYFEPLPNKIIVLSFPVLMAVYCRMWKLMPHEKKVEDKFRKKCKIYILYELWNMFVVIQLTGLSILLGIVPADIQWLVSLVVPLNKEINSYVLSKLITKSSLTENLVQAKFMVGICNNLNYSFWFAIMATTATMATNYFLLGINFCLNMALCYKIIRLNRKVVPTDSEQDKKKLLTDDTITELILNETVEIIVPIAFMGSFSIAYYGPNKYNIGIVGCSIWTFHKVEDISIYFVPVIQIALIDSVSLILAGGLLWWFCKINILQRFCVIIKKYWTFLAIWGGLYINAVRITVKFLIKTTIIF